MAIFNNLPYTDLHELNLDWILKTLKKLNDEWEELKAYVTNSLADMGNDINEIQNWIAQFDENTFKQWIVEQVNLYLTAGVYFGLTNDGYFVAYIPQSWNMLQFGTTGLDSFPDVPVDYGHLTLSLKEGT